MPFGQLVIGPPGSGKTTYCAGAQQLLGAAARRVALVNLDPANDGLPYTPDVDVMDLVCLESVMQELGLGPNGGEGAAARPSAQVGAGRAPPPLPPHTIHSTLPPPASPTSHVPACCIT